MESDEKTHIPVLPEPIADHFADALPGPLVDCTLGLGGHTALLLERNPELEVIGLDVDEASLEAARARLQRFEGRVRYIRANFAELREALAEAGVVRAGGILADLGLCSAQIEDAERGFSFDRDGPLDMRLDRRLKTTAADLVNTLGEGELSDLLYLQSQEQHSRKIARRICQARRQGRLNSTVAFARLVAAAMGENPDSHRSRIHPATRTFMALRMAVNHETDALTRLLDEAPRCLAQNGRIAVISFHSAEDRLVKQRFRDLARDGVFRLLTKKPIVAEEEERMINPRSRSAKLRIAECVAGA